MQDKLLGLFESNASLSAVEREIVAGTWKAAEQAYVPRSNFPVGSVILAANDAGDVRSFSGCNVENRFFTATICAERNAATSAVAAGYRKFLKVGLVLQKYQGPGASPCGLCRQVLVEFGADAEILNVADKDSNIRRFKGSDLLPAACGHVIPHAELDDETKDAVWLLRQAIGNSYTPYSKAPRAAVVVASHESGQKQAFFGVPDDNSSYGGSALAECVAMRAARASGFNRNVTLLVTVDDQRAINPIDGESLQVLREFGLASRILLVGSDDSVVESSLPELLPESFGPEALV